jgi:hypothetical protein
VSSRRIAAFFGAAGVVLVPWTFGLALALPCRYVSAHWGIAWAGFDTALAAGLSLTGYAILRRATWLDRVATATATLLAADAWFDVLTARTAAAIALATAEALLVELPTAALCIWVARRLMAPPPQQERSFI